MCRFPLGPTGTLGGSNSLPRGCGHGSPFCRRRHATRPSSSSSHISQNPQRGLQLVQPCPSLLFFILQLLDDFAQVKHEFPSGGIVPARFSRTFFPGLRICSKCRELHGSDFAWHVKLTNLTF